MCLICSPLARSQDAGNGFYLRGFAERARRVISFYDTSAQAGYAQAALCYALNKNTVRADSMINVLLKNPSGDMFWMFSTIGSYLYGGERMSGQTRAAVRNAWKTYRPYRGDTENHWCLYYASLLLASEQWQNLPGDEWFNGKTSEENYSEAKGYLIHWINLTTTIGQGEFDSPDYFPVFVSAMILLSQFAEEPAIKKRSSMMADYLFADFAAEHLEGQYTGGFSRIYQPAVYKPLASNAAPFAYLYFGKGEEKSSDFALFAAISSYRLPEIIYKIATDRSTPYIHREKKRVRNVIRFGSEMNPPVYKYTYMTKDYSIGSLQGGILQPIQQHTWGVHFTSGKPYTAIFGLHPCWSGTELGMFFPEEVKQLTQDVSSSKSTYSSPDKWTGGSPYERTFQHKNTLIVLYDIPPGTKSDEIDGLFPANLDERFVDTSGWIISRAGDTYIGWYPLASYKIEDEGVYLRLRSHELQNGYIIEVRSKSETGPFGNFKEKLRAHIPISKMKQGSVSVRYFSIDGDKMEFMFPGKRIFNGTAVDFSRYKLFEGPFLNAGTGSKKLTITYKDKKRVLDFQLLKVSE